MFHTRYQRDPLALPEILEAIFAFLSRKDLYRSCTGVNHQWNTVSKHVIRKKRKAEFISIPGIRDNIIFHLFESLCNIAEFTDYCYVSETWSNALNYLRAKERIITSLEHHDCFINSYPYNRRRIHNNKKRLIHCFARHCAQYYLKDDHELNGYYQNILS